MGVCPVEVSNDFRGAIIQRVTDFARREHHVNVFWHELEKLEGVAYGGGEVVVVLKGIAEDSAHHIDVLDFLGYKIHSVERGIFVRFGLEELGKAGHEAY